MEMKGEQRIAAPRTRVWEALNDPDVLRQCIPGCQSLEKEGDDRLKAIVEIKIGPIGARFAGAVTISDAVPPESYTISGEGQGGTVGNAKGGAKVHLAEDGGSTLLSYQVEAQVGGRLAQLGGPIIDATAKQLAGRFFTKFGEIVGQPVPAPEPATSEKPVEVAAAPAVAPAYAAPEPVIAPSGGSAWGWFVALALAVIAGFVVGQSGTSNFWIVLVIIAIFGAAAAGFEAGKRAGGRR